MDNFISEEPSFSESLLEATIIGIPTATDASTFYKYTSQPCTLYTRYPIVARRPWPTGCIDQPLGRVRRASKGILHTNHNPQTTENSLGVASTTTTIRGRKGPLFEGRKFTSVLNHSTLEFRNISESAPGSCSCIRSTYF